MTESTPPSMIHDLGYMKATQEAVVKRIDGLEDAMKAGFDELKKEMHRLGNRFEDSQSKQDARIDALESGKDRVSGIGAGAGWLVGAISSLIALAEFLHIGGGK
jgi:hypothetical protein